MESARPVVLVVEDAKAITESLCELLSGEDYAVETAADGAAGLARVRQGGVDLVLLDLILPDMHGLDVCREIRALESKIYLPVIMLTALATDSDRHAGFAAGADDYLLKPFLLTDVLDHVRVWVRTRQYLKMMYDRTHRSVAEDQSSLSIALSTSHDLMRLLMLFLSLLESWETSTPSQEDINRLRTPFGEATTARAARINTLTRDARSPS